MTTRLDEIDPTFIADLRGSEAAVERGAGLLRGMGFEVWKPPLRIRPDSAVRAQFRDKGDLYASKDGQTHRVEVKQRITTHFTGRHDFPYATIIVDVCHAYDGAEPKPWKYLLFNKPLTCVAIVHCATTEALWLREKQHSRGRERFVYGCPVDLAAWARLRDR